jgi:hypothetical protein
MKSSPQHPYTLPSRSKANRTNQNLSKSMAAPTLKNKKKIKHENTTMAIRNAGFGAKLKVNEL